jgi:ring-1,2-phenylacetyl-CoA epoxidase subunit PaaE
MPFGFFKKKNKDTEVAPESPVKKAVASNAVQYRRLKVKEVIKETADAITIAFEQPAEGTINYKAGQFFTLIPVIDGKKVRRAYSVCTSPYTDANPAVTVKRVEEGLVSNFLNDHLKAGDELEVMDPMGNFAVVPGSQARHLVLLGGGSGITPLIAIAKTILSQEPTSQLTLIYANRNAESIIFKDELHALQAANADRFTVKHILDAGAEGYGAIAGPPTEAVLLDQLKAIASSQNLPTTYWVCGPEGMMANSLKALESLGIEKERVFKESFLPGTPETKASEEVAEAEGGTNQSYEVKVIVDEEEHVFVVEPGKTILETALELDIDLPYSCQSGLCTACRGKCISGKVKLDEDEGLSEDELEEGYVLTCVGRPLTNNVVIEIG